MVDARWFLVEIAKALILAGCRTDDPPWPSLRSGPKQLVPVGNKPILFHNLEALRKAGVLEATIALEPESGEAIRAAVQDGSRFNLSVGYVEWPSGAGVADALQSSRHFIGDEPVLVEQADALVSDRMHPHIAAFAGEALDALALRFAGPSAAEQGVLGAYLLSRRGLTFLLERPDAGEDLLLGVRSRGGRVDVQDLDGCLPCHGGEEALLEANRRILARLTGDHDPASLVASDLQGPVVVHPTARLERSLVRGPAIIGPGCRLTDAYVGPYTSIGADVAIEGAEIEHSIVLDGAQLRFVGVRIETSVIGRGAQVIRGFALGRAMQLSVGDGAEIRLS
jgi:glucose-1-phosphate thymidylyltransferase